MPMYIPAKYRELRVESVQEFLRENAFGILISEGNQVPFASHIPLELHSPDKGSPILEGHLSNSNPQTQALKSGMEVLCIFNGPHAYISSSWYQEEEVPTWDYMAVHVRGTLQILSEAALLASLHRLVDKYEADSDHPVSLHDMSEKTMRQIRGITGFTISISKVEAAFKLSQGREADHPRIIRELEARGGMPSVVAKKIKEL
jgi:transcriptional regulator